MGLAARERVREATLKTIKSAYFALSKITGLIMRILMIIDGLPGGGAEKTVLTSPAD